MKHTFTHYFVQAKEEDKNPFIVCHSKDEETGELYHEFLDKKKANSLLEAEKKLTPTNKFRIIKRTEIFEEGDWQ